MFGFLSRIRSVDITGWRLQIINFAVRVNHIKIFIKTDLVDSSSRCDLHFYQNGDSAQLSCHQSRKFIQMTEFLIQRQLIEIILLNKSISNCLTRFKIWCYPGIDSYVRLGTGFWHKLISVRMQSREIRQRNSQLISILFETQISIESINTPTVCSMSTAPQVKQNLCRDLQ